ncbi:hypothetical protein SAMN04487765_1775 [Tenacibaculum sp. MAR_2010_89]|uniref:hypothetical protein n=1 Tax=Tenacibaculum sp. MAR_2010_89 TaxID=1250198 RepID=UPI00089C3572|nr:hypothetical protein [Tenacibaculum sp. MAR_2010_89]SEE21149.1 hypothetical protein SAMN04487765_1775 [Tenacibaculum sp. MAR_2010_89]
MENKKAPEKSKIDFIKWFINTVVIGLLTFFFSWVLDERKQGVEEIKVYNTYVELITKVDGLAERRLLAEFFSNVTVSGQLKEGWKDYYDILDKQYKNEIAKQDLIISKTDTTTIEGKFELEKAILKKSKIEGTGVISPIITKLNPQNFKLALQKELEGFSLLIDKDIEGAILAFSESENAYNSFHQVYEIEKYLKSKLQSEEVKSDEFWKIIYKDLLEKYSWKMPKIIKFKLENFSK